MGKKAVNLLLHTILILLTFVTAALTGLATFGAHVDPASSGLLSLLTLGMPLLVAANVFFMLLWIVRLRVWLVFPLIALLANFNYYPRIMRIASQRAIPNAGATQLRVATYNVNYFGYGDEFTVTVNSMAAQFKPYDLDVICFQEFATQRDFPADSIAAAFGLPFHATGINSEKYHDLAIFSRYPISGVHRMIFPKSPNSAMWADLDVKGRTVRIVNAHLQTTSVNQEKGDLKRQLALGTAEDQARAAIRISRIMTRNASLRAAQARLVAAAMDSVPHPVIYCGDSNDVPSSYVYRTLTGGGKRIDGFREAGNGYAYTFRNMHRLLRIDYIFYSDNVRGLDYISPQLGLSDHNAVLMQLEF